MALAAPSTVNGGTNLQAPARPAGKGTVGGRPVLRGPRVAHHKHLHHLGACRSAQCDRHWYHAHWYHGQTTYYSPGRCDSTGGGLTTAWGTRVYFGEVANSVLPLGTKIWVDPAIKGHHRFRVEDRFGYPPQPVGRLDVWVPCGDSIPNPWVRFRIIRY